MMKKLIAGTILALSALLPTFAFAVNITVPSATSFGQVLRGNANGTYTPVATSTLGISGGGTPGGSNTQVQFNNSGSFGGAKILYDGSGASRFLGNSSVVLSVSSTTINGNSGQETGTSFTLVPGQGLFGDGDIVLGNLSTTSSFYGSGQTRLGSVSAFGSQYFDNGGQEVDAPFLRMNGGTGGNLPETDGIRLTGGFITLSSTTSPSTDAATVFETQINGGSVNGPNSGLYSASNSLIDLGRASYDGFSTWLGGDLTLMPGYSISNGVTTRNTVSIEDPVTFLNAKFDTSLLTQNRTLTFFNGSGIICLANVNCASTTTSNTWSGTQTFNTLYSPDIESPGNLFLAANGDGASISEFASNATSAGKDGGYILFGAGTASTTGTGGNIEFDGGYGSTNNINGTGDGGQIRFYGGAGGANNGHGGDVVFSTGKGGGSGTDGLFKFLPKSGLGGSTFGILNFDNLDTSDKTFTFPNQSGTLCLSNVNCAATTTANSWSQLQQFNSGLTAYASSTIGNGTATGGLTINGNATTTASFKALYIWGAADATMFAGSDIGAKVNAAYAALPSTGGAIRIPAGSYSFSTTINLNTNNKPASLLCDEAGSTILTYTGSATSTIFNFGRIASSEGVIAAKGCSFVGPGTAGISSAISIGGSNGSQGYYFKNINVSGFGQTGAIYTDDNTALVTLEDFDIHDNGKNFLYGSSVNAGEQMRFVNGLFADSQAVSTSVADNCFDVKAFGMSDLRVSNVSFDDCQIHLGNGTRNAVFEAPHIEDPAKDTIVKYTPIIIDGNNVGAVTFVSPHFFNGANTQRPNEYVKGGAMAEFTGVTTIFDNGAGTPNIPFFYTNTGDQPMSIGCVSLITTGTMKMWQTSAGVGTYSQTCGTDGSLTVATSSSLSLLTLQKYYGNAKPYLMYIASSTNSSGTLSNPLFDIDKSGNVGIGTSTPYAPLSIWGKNTTSGNRAFEVISSASTTNFFVDNAGNATLSNTLNVNGNLNLGSTAITTTDNGNEVINTNWGWNIKGDATHLVQIVGTSLMIGQSAGFPAGVTFPTNSLLVNGSVGIGTTSPVTKFDIFQGDMQIYRQGGNPALYLHTDDSTNQSRTKTGIAATGGGSFGIGDLTFFLNNAQDSSSANITNDARVTIKSQGAVGIGTTTPYAKLSVHGNANDQTIYKTLFAVSSSTAAATTTLFSITNTGAIFAPNTASSGSSQTGYWCYDGSGQLIRDTAACLVSAARFKQNINPLPNSLATLMAIKPVTYFWKPDYNGVFQNDPNYSGQQMGFIADQVGKVDPRLMAVTTATTTFEGKAYAPGVAQSINDRGLLAVLWESVQEQQKEIESLGGHTVESTKEIAQSAQDKWQDIALAVLALLFGGYVVYNETRRRNI